MTPRVANRYYLDVTINGLAYEFDVGAETTLLELIRDHAGLTGTKEGCDDSECGACMVLVDGQPVNSCCRLALQADGTEVTTVEGLRSGDQLHPLQRAFLDKGGVQCGFCTPGMLMSASALLDANSDPTVDEIRIALSGNLCRCTGYQGIVKAVQNAATELRTAR
jgi:aerobic-type carbon monoxide dehydrogenase small subunit (CoxS/CutS family)